MLRLEEAATRESRGCPKTLKQGAAGIDLATRKQLACLWVIFKAPRVVEVEPMYLSKRDMTLRKQFFSHLRYSGQQKLGCMSSSLF